MDKTIRSIVISTFCCSILLWFIARAVTAADDLLPDIIARQSDLLIHDIDTTSQPGQIFFRLSNGTANRGAGMLYLRNAGLDTSGRVIVMQRIFRTDSTWWEQLAGHFVYHPQHMHTHFEDWADYRIREILPGGGVGPILASTDKVSFCIIDESIYDNTLPNYTGAHFHTCGDSVQGLSVGYVDVYDKTTPGQNIDITNLPNASYWLESEADPLNHVVESDETNNASRIAVDLCIHPTDRTPDSIWINSVSGRPGQIVRVDVGVTNSTPLRQLTIPIEYGGPLNLTFLSVSTTGLRTEYFDLVDLTSSDPAHSRVGYSLQPSSVPFAKPELAPGSGPVLSFYFRISNTAQPGENPIVFRLVPFSFPGFTDACGTFQPPTTIGGNVRISCCTGIVGNVDCDPSDIVDIADLTRLIDYSLLSLSPLCCTDEANIDLEGSIDIADLSRLIDFLYISHGSLENCPN